jgi:hypothetical protein
LSAAVFAIWASVACNQQYPPYVTSDPFPLGAGSAAGSDDGGSGASSSGSPGGAGSTGSSPGSLAITDGAACGTIPPPALVTQQEVAQVGPIVTGGTIAPGLYFLTAMNKYTGLTGATGPTTKVQAQSILLDSSTYQSGEAGPTADGGLGYTSFNSGSYTAKNKTYATSATCGVGGIPVSYTAENNLLKLSFLNEEYVFTLQP